MNKTIKFFRLFYICPDVSIISYETIPKQKITLLTIFVYNFHSVVTCIGEEKIATGSRLDIEKKNGQI